MTTGTELDAALRTLHDAHSLALRLQQAGVADEVICRYLHVEAECVSTRLDVATRKEDTTVRYPYGPYGLQPLHRKAHLLHR